MFACRSEQFERVDESVERVVCLFSEYVLFLCADTARRVQRSRVVLAQRGEHHVELPELGAFEITPNSVSVLF
jgi:hypothetical protein